MRVSKLACLVMGCAMVASSIARGDSISPASYEDTLGIGGSVTIRKTVTVTEEPPTSALVDVYFLVDTTGSMGTVINNVRNGIGQIITNTSGLGNVHYGVGEYKDFGDVFVFRENTDLTNVPATITAGVNALGASGGGDTPEANLFGLTQMSSQTSWRAGSTRIAVWIGDAPGHDPSGGATLASTIAALNGQNIVVEAFSATSGPGIDSTGQATAIAAGTGGAFLGNISTNLGAAITAISNAITSVLDTYTTVSLAPVGNLPGVGVSITPLSIVGAFDRSIERTFNFDVTFTGLVPGDHAFTINALVDGGIVATESDLIHVRDGVGGEVPEPATLLVWGCLSSLAVAQVVIRRRKNS